MAKKSKYRIHLEAIARSLTCINDYCDNERFLDDVVILRTQYRKLYKAQRYLDLYPTAQPERWNEMVEDVTSCRKIIIEICKEWDIGFQFFKRSDYEFTKLEMPVRLMRKGYVMNEYLDF